MVQSKDLRLAPATKKPNCAKRVIPKEKGRGKSPALGCALWKTAYLPVQSPHGSAPLKYR